MILSEKNRITKSSKRETGDRWARISENGQRRTESEIFTSGGGKYSLSFRGRSRRDPDPALRIGVNLKIQLHMYKIG